MLQVMEYTVAGVRSGQGSQVAFHNAFKKISPNTVHIGLVTNSVNPGLLASFR